MIYKKQNPTSTYTFKSVNLSSRSTQNRPCTCREFCDFPPQDDCHGPCKNDTCWQCPNCNMPNCNFCPPNFCWQNNSPCFDNGCNPCTPPNIPQPNCYKGDGCFTPPSFCPPQPSPHNCNQNNIRYLIIGYLIGGIDC